jgi:hypothetical protein
MNEMTTRTEVLKEALRTLLFTHIALYSRYTISSVCREERPKEIHFHSIYYM